LWVVLLRHADLDPAARLVREGVDVAMRIHIKLIYP
jgi:hypothetical protein